MRYVLDFGSANAGGTPSFLLFARVDTLGALAQPAIEEIGSGQYYFDFDWTAAPTTSITYKATLAGIELSDVISGPSAPGALPAVPAAVPLTGFTTAGDIVNRAAKQLGLGPVPDAYGSTDPKIVQLCELLTAAGQKLVGKYRWGQLRREFTFTTLDGTLTYALPEDFSEMVPQTEFNRSTSFPGYTVTPQQTQALKARVAGLTTDFMYEQRGTQIVCPVQPQIGATVGLVYVSSWWVQSEGASGPDTDEPASNGAICLFDPPLLIAALKLEYLGEKGFDVTKAQGDYEDTLDDAKARSKSSPVLSLSGRIGPNIPSIGPQNLPITGWGQKV